MAPTQPPSARSLGRTTLSSIAALIAALAFIAIADGSPPKSLALPIGLLFAAAGLIWHQSLPSQFLARAVFWSNLLLGVLLSISGGSGERVVGLALAAANATALLAAGRVGLATPSESFSPAAFRGSLIVALVMALADTQSLALFGTLHLERHALHDAWPLLGCAALMGVAIVGLYRLKVWGLVVNVVANLAIAAAALAGAFDLPRGVPWALATTAVIQLVLPLPMIVAMVRGRPPAPSRSDRVGAVIIPVVVVALVALAVVGVQLRGDF